jgi:hypothetical protein
MALSDSNSISPAGLKYDALQIIFDEIDWRQCHPADVSTRRRDSLGVNLRKHALTILIRESVGFVSLFVRD